MGRFSIVSPLWKVLGGLATLVLAFQTLFPQYEIIPLSRNEYVALLICAILGWAVWAAWVFWKHYGFQIVRKKDVKLPAPTVPSTPESKQELGFELCTKREVPRIDTLLKDAKQNGEVWVMGIDCSYWLTGAPDKVRELARVRNLSLTFLLAAEGTKSMELAEGAELISSQSGVTHSRCVESFNSIRSGSGNAQKFRLGLYDLPLVHSMVVVNPNTEDEQIVVDHYLYSVDRLELPSLVLKRAHLSDQMRVVFDQYHKSIDYVMHKAKDPDGKPLLG